MKRELICIQCPKGCLLEADVDQGRLLEVRGHACRRGQEYAEKEILAPERTVTTTVAIHGAGLPLVPVRTDRSVPLERCVAVLDAARQVRMAAPVRVGDVVLRNVADTGADLVVTRDLDAA
jgi:CxxC motif-containing protein